MEAKLKVKDFDLYATLTCGQAFRWGIYDSEGNFLYGKRDSKGYIYGIAYGCAFAIKQEGEELFLRSSCRDIYVPFLNTHLTLKDFAEYYFSLDVDVSRIERFVEFDPRLREMYSRFKGIRILRQEANEIAITFMFSANNSVRNIAKAVNMLSSKFPHAVEFEGKLFYTFPNVSDIAKLSVDELGDLPVRFESRLYLTLELASYLTKFNIYTLHSRNMNYSMAHEKLVSLKGIGRKIADCILLFSLEHWEAFPIDVHIRSMMLKLFGKELGISPQKKTLTDKDYRMIRTFAQAKFDGWAGWVQQYIYSSSRKPELTL